MVLDAREVGVSPIRWRPCHRILPTRFPPIQLFERVADPADLEAVLAIESLSNSRLRNEVGELSLVPSEERVSGPGSSYIMAAFTHIAPDGGRFTDRTYGAYYTAGDLETAIDETVYHRERFLRATSERPMELEMRVIRATLKADLHDLRGLREHNPDIYDLLDYGASQRLGRALRAAGSWGVVYQSVRREGGQCAAVFRPRALSSCRQAQHLGYVWDGTRISHVYEKRLIRRGE